MKSTMSLLAILIAGCAVERAVQRPAESTIAVSDRGAVFARALDVVKRHGWPVSITDPASGVITTSPAYSGLQPCGLTTCNSRTAVQIAVPPDGVVSVTLHREFNVPPPGYGWFVPTVASDVKPIEAEERALLDEILTR